MKPFRVLGIGSPLGDDQIGWKVTEALEKQACWQPYVDKQLQFVYCDRPSAQLLAEIEGADAVWLIDAVKSGLPAGQLHYYQGREILSAQGLLSSHDVGVQAALGLADALNMLPRQIRFYGIEMQSCEQGEISAVVKAAIPDLVEKIRDDLLAVLDNL